MPTINITNSTHSACNYGTIDGCWRSSTTAQAGDVVAVHIYYKNTSNTASQGTTLGMKPQSSGATTSVSFTGGVASLSGPRATGSASLSISSSQTVSYIPGSGKWYPSATSGTRSIDAGALFGTGFNIGTVNPGEQGVLVAFFQVGNDVVTTTYQCNDGQDNDGDLRTDYPNDPGCSTYNDDSEYNQVIISNIAPQAVTTLATPAQTSARLNGVAVPNSTYATTAWFEWGTSGNLGSRTTAQSVTNNTSTPISDTVYGFVPGGVYYYRTVVQNQNGTAYGSIERFQTVKNTVVVNPPTVITKVVNRDVVVTKSTPSLLELRVENVYDRMCIAGEMDYTVTYRNISGQTLQNTVLRIAHPKELTFINSSRGDYEVVDRTVTIALGDVRPGEQGTVQVRARVNNTAVVGNLAVTTATVVYTNTISRAQEDAIAYSLVTVSNDCPNVLGASAFGISSFFPNTLLGWLLLILVILALIVLGRQMYKKRD